MRTSALALVLVLSACSRDAGTSAVAAVGAGSAGASVVYPRGPYGATVGAIVSDAAWPGVSATGALGSVALDTARDDALDTMTSAPVLVVRIGAGWCGTCQWHAGHATTLLSSDVGPRVRLFDVLLFGEDNAPATLDDAVAWQALQDVRTDVAIDPTVTVQPFLPAQTRLPYVLVIDARTMTLRDALSMPTEDALEQSVRTALATIDGVRAPAVTPPALVDGRFTRDEWDLVSAMTLTDPPPPETTNAFADSIPAAALGGKVFSDLTFSPTDQVACASCHAPLRQFADGSPTPPEGVGRVTRNAPSLTLSAYERWQFWDGRADSQWSQALMPIELPNEMGSSRLFVAHTIFEEYQPQYEAIFGTMPPLDDSLRFPANGKPGDPAWEAMAPADQTAVTRILVNVGKSLEAFERTFRGAGSQLDSYIAGDATALTDAEKDGLLAFLQSGCVQCHWGPRMTDDAFHVLRFPTGSTELGPDPGRQTGIPQLLASDFGAGGVWSDDTSKARPAPVAGAWTLGAFKTPQLRNVALTAPYGHGGNYGNLSDVVELIRTGGLAAGSPLTTGTTEPWVAPFDAANDAPITSFLDVLDQQVTH